MFFELIMDFIFELLLSNGLRSVSNRRIPFVLRLLLGFFFLAVVGGFNLLLVWIGFALISQNHSVFGLILVLLGSCFFLMFVKTLRAEVNARNNDEF